MTDQRTAYPRPIRMLIRFLSGSSLRRMRLSIALLTERRVALLLTVDALFLFFGFLAALESRTGGAKEFYLLLFLLPALILGLPILAEAVVVERRSGTLDLALSSAGSATYFQRRIGSFALLIVAQGWLGLLLARALIEPFPLSGPMIQIAVVTIFLGSVVLNWSVRFQSMGAVVVLTLLSCIALAPWFFSNPVHPYAEFNRPMNVEEIFAWFRTNLVLLGGAAVSYLYAIKRLMSPELILGNGA